MRQQWALQKGGTRDGGASAIAGEPVLVFADVRVQKARRLRLRVAAAVESCTK